MTCGINLGILLIVFIQAVHICCSWVLPDGGNWKPLSQRPVPLSEGSRTDRTNTPVGLSHVRGRFEGSRPQDEFRQAYVVKISSTGARADQRPYAHTASLAVPVKFSQSSQTNPKGSNVDTSYGNVRPKNTFGLSTSIASGSSVSKQDSKQDSKQHNGVLRTWPGQQGAVRTSQYVYSKPDSHSSKQTLLSQSRSQKPTALKQMHGLDKGTQGLKWNSKLTPPKEYVKATSGLSHGRKVTGGSRKSPYLPSRLGQTSQRPNSWQSGLQQSPKGSDYNRIPKPVPVHQSEKLRPGMRFSPTRLYNIPWYFGGHSIKRLGDEELVERTTTTHRPKKPAAPHPAKTYTFPPRHTESHTPLQQSVHQKSRWMRVRSNQLTGAAGVLRQSF